MKNEEGWDWEKNAFREDPVTNRNICRYCWNGLRGEWHDDGKRKWLEAGCKVAACGCACYEEAKASCSARARRADATKKKKATLKAMLESPDSPLRANAQEATA